MFHFSRGIPPQEAIPARQIAEHTATVLREHEDRVFQYAPIGNHTGDAALREQLAAFHSVGADQIFVTNGSLQALDLLAAHLLAGDRKDVYVEARPTTARCRSSSGTAGGSPASRSSTTAWTWTRSKRGWQPGAGVRLRHPGLPEPERRHHERGQAPPPGTARRDP